MSHDQTYEQTMKGLAIRKQMELPTKPPPPPNRWRTEYKRAVNEWFVYDAGGFLDCTLKSQKTATRIVQMGNRIEEQREAQARLEQQATQIAAMADKMLLVLRAVVSGYDNALLQWEGRADWIKPEEPNWVAESRAIVDQFKTVEV